MTQLENLRLICKKFIDMQYTVEELSQTLSWIAVPSEIKELINEAEYRLENIRFGISDDQQYDEALIVVNEILSKVEEIK